LIDRHRAHQLSVRIGRLLTGAMLQLERWAVYPTALAAAVILTLHTDAGASTEALLRPLAIAVAATLSIQVIVALATRHGRQAALVAVLPIAMLVPWLLAIHVALALVSAVAVIRRRPIVPWAGVTGFLNTASLLVLVMALYTSALSGGLQFKSRTSAPSAEAEANAPDIWLVLLDGYPRADTLLEDFGIDNAPFLQAMEAEGFTVARQSRSNYNMTSLTLASMFNFAPVQDLPFAKEAGSPVDQYRGVSQALNSGRAIDALHSYGYHVISIVPPFDEAALFSADLVIDSGQLTSFEVKLLHEPLVRNVLPELQADWFTDQHRARIQSSITTAHGLAREHNPRPRFILAHLMAPHGPLVFGPNGEARPLWPCFPADCEFWDSGWRHGVDVVAPALADELTFLNAQILQLVRAIKANADRPPVILVMSDHGFRHDPQNRAETNRNLFAAYTPGHDELFAQDATPINTFPRILNAYLDARLTEAPEDLYWTDMTTLMSAGLLKLEAIR
jgi:hypothetical protein